MIYYILLLLATLCYTFSFLMNKKVQVCCFESIDTTILFLLVSQLEVFVVIFFCLSGQLHFTPFSVICAAMQAVLVGLFTLLNLKALGIVDVAKYSLYTMLGGMLVPFFYGVLFANEGLTAAKVICCILVSLALLVDSWGAKTNKRELLYLFSVFLVNGLFGVLASIHQNSSYAHLDTLGYMSVQSLIICIASSIFLTAKRLKAGKLHAVREKPKQAYLYMLLYGIFYYGAELIVLVAVIHIPTSVQFPIITGGTLVFSTVISMLMGEAKDTRRYVSLALSILGLVCLLF